VAGAGAGVLGAVLAATLWSTTCHSATTLAASAPLATPSTPSAAVRSMAGQRIHRNPDAADNALAHPTL
jgi:hypothetical protein